MHFWIWRYFAYNFFFYLATTFAPILQSLKGKSRLETKIPEEYLAYILYPTKGAVVWKIRRVVKEGGQSKLWLDPKLKLKIWT